MIAAFHATGASAGTQTADAGAGAQVFSVHCSACHGTDGSGGVGPNLHGIAGRKSLDQTIAFIENPEQFRRLKSDPELVRSAVEEIV